MVQKKGKAMRTGMDDPDQSLIQAIAAGDSHAFHLLYERHGLQILDYLIGQLGNRQLAEDVLQNVMLAIWKGAADFRGDSQARTWIFAIARRQMLKARRHVLPVDHLLDDDLLPNGNDLGYSFENASQFEILSEGIGQLPVDQQQALELVFYRGLKIAEAAERLGVPANTLKSRLHRAKKALRKLLVHEEINHE